MTLQRSSLKFVISVIQISTCTTKFILILFSKTPIVHKCTIAITKTLYHKSPEPPCC